MPTGEKHMITCRCILTQFRSLPDPPSHRFIVFSVINDDDTVVPKIVQCNNCGILHRVTDLCMSQIINGKEHSKSLLTIDEVRASIPDKLAFVLDQNNADLATWEAVKFTLDNEKWGNFVMLTSDVVDDDLLNKRVKYNKYVQILSRTIYKIDTNVSDVVISQA